MSQNSQNSLIITASGILGGLGKAVFSNQVILADISWKGTLEVTFYAAISAIVGYAVKIGIDKIKNILKR
jgi:hypothetical protein